MSSASERRHVCRGGFAPVVASVAACAAGLLLAACAAPPPSQRPTLQPGLAAPAGRAATHQGDVAGAPPLRVCADPNNMPFSNDRRQGFENEIAALVAGELHRPLAYEWRPQRRGFVRNTLDAGVCDLIVGVPARYERVTSTRPYYRSTYVFVQRESDTPRVRSFDDPALRRLRIGLHVIGDDYNNPPPAQALAWRGIVDNLHGYSIYGDYSRPHPPGELIDALARGEIDVAIAWGPMAGWFAQHEPVAMDVVPVQPQLDRQQLPMFFDIAMGVRRGNRALQGQVQDAIDRRLPEIHAVLRRYGVPVLPMTAAAGPVALKD